MDAAAGLDQFQTVIDLRQSATVARWVMDDSAASFILGPFGSGKTVGGCVRVGRHALQQRPDRNGYRKTRWAVIRNTYPELLTTTLKTWEKVFPATLCGEPVYSKPIEHRIVRHPEHFEWVSFERNEFNGTPGVDMEVFFLALDKPEDVRKLKSLDLTGVFMNEACEIPVEILDVLTSRVGRFPDVEDGGCTWRGIFGDTNAPDETNWYYKASVEGQFPDLTIETPEGEVINVAWTFFTQPPAVLECEPYGGGYRVKDTGFDPVMVPQRQVMSAAGRVWCVNPDAENRLWLEPGYYQRLVFNKTLAWIQRYLQARWVIFTPGKPWIPEYNDAFMCRPLQVSDALDLLCGIDIGGGTLNPAAEFGQIGPMGDWRLLAELCIFDIGLEVFTTAFHHLMAQKFPGRKLKAAYVDPAANTRDPLYAIAVEQHLKAQGIPVVLAPTNRLATRREAYALPMGRTIQTPDGTMISGFNIDPEGCPMLRQALMGKWYLRRMQVANENIHTNEPVKNQWSHPGDAGGYLLLGGGEYRRLTTGRTPASGKAHESGQQAFERAMMSGEPISTAGEWSPFD